jgi:hypothetical protein
MSRITGSDAASLIEAYAAVYAPQELTEEQVWEEVENWVNSLVEEGYDLSEYTWEDMYEAYIEEQGNRNRPGDAARIQRVAAQRNVQTALGQGRGIELRGATSGKPQGTGYGTQLGGRQGVIVKGGNEPVRSGRASQTAGVNRAQPINVGGRTLYPAAKGKDIVYLPSKEANAKTPLFTPKSQQPAPRPAAPAPAPRPAAPAPRPAAPAPAPRPAAPATIQGGPRPTATPTTTTAPATTTPATTPAPRQRDTSISDMIGRSQIRQGAPINTGNRSSDIRSMALRGSVGATPTPTPTTKPNLQQQIRQRRLNMDLDLFDIVQGYLLDEGYAETEEAAAVIMANMSEEWKTQIIESGYFPTKESQREDEAKYKKGSSEVKHRTAQTQARPTPSK